MLKLKFLSKVFWLSKRQAVLEVTFLSSLCVLLLYYCYDCLRCDKVCRYHYLLWNWSNFKSKDNKCPVIIWISHHCTDSDCQVNHKGAILVDQWPIQKSNKIDSKITKFSWDNCNLFLTPNDFFIQKEVHMNWRIAKSKNNYMKIEMSILIFRNIRGIIHPSKLCIVFKIHISGILDL